MREFANKVNGGETDAWAELTANIDLSEICSEESDTSWTPIGNSIGNSYRGTFNGAGHTISGLYINSSSANDQGLFGYVYGGTVKDLSVSGSVSGDANVGGIAGQNNGNVINCAFSGSVSGSYVGGVVGDNDGGRVENCYNIGEVSGNSYVGGVVGYSSGGISASASVTNCYNTGTVTGTDDYVGGVVGGNDSGTVKNCYNTGSVKGSGDRVGGVVGYNDEGRVENCYNTGAVNSSGNYVGGVVGENPSGRVENSYNTGAVSGGEYVGGVVGYNYFRGSVTNSYNTGAVSGGEDVGGVVGQNYSSSTVKNCYNTGTVTGPSTNVGGVVGDNRGPVENCYNTGNISGNVSGGVVGQNHGSVTNCYNIGTVTGTDDYVGGVVGYNFSSVTNCYFLQGTAEKGIGGGEEIGATAEPVDNLDELCNALKGDTWSIHPVLGRPVLNENKEGGLGTDKSPYEISTADELKNFATAVNGKDDQTADTDAHAKLMNNINLSSVCGPMLDDGNPVSWEPIGNSFSNPYSGTFNGNGKTISGLYIVSSSDNNQGLFGYVYGGTVQDLTVSGSVSGGGDVGGIVGFNNGGTVTGCIFSGSGSVIGSNSVGGVVGENSGIVINCYNTGSVTGVTGTVDYVGGVVGQNFGGTVKNCYNTGSVSGSGNSNYIGGVVGWNISSGNVKNCYYQIDKGATVGIGNETTADTSKAEGKTDAQFASGEVAYLLQDTQTTPVWGQSALGTEDSLPTLVALNPDAAKEVYQLTFDWRYEGAPEGTTTTTNVYTNGSVAIPEINHDRAGYHISGWKDASGAPVTTETAVTADTTYIAEWTANTYTITVTAGSGGTVSGSGEYSEGTQVTVTATPATGYHFVNWTENGTEVSTEATFTFNATVDRNLIAIFAKNEEPEPTPTPTPTPDPTPSGPSTGDSSGWDDIRDELENAENSDEITIDMGDETKVPAEIFESLAGKDVEISFDLGDVQWTVNGADIPTDTDFTDLDLGASLGTSGIPVNVINTITGEVGTVQITLAHDGDFGFTMTLSAPLGKENAGYWANLYHYDEDAEALNFEAAAEIDADGSVTIPFSHASQYAIVIDTHSHATVDVSDLFIDIAPDAWYKDAVQYAYDNGLMTGVSATEFAPEATTTRAMIVSILARLEGVTTAEAAGFADVNDEWYATAVNWAANVGVVNGYEDNTFRPNTAITREQLAAILMNYAAYKGEDVSNRADLASYTDQPSTWAEETMSWAVAEGLISGVTADTLQPQGAATRAQVAAILQRFLEA